MKRILLLSVLFFALVFAGCAGSNKGDGMIDTLPSPSFTTDNNVESPSATDDLQSSKKGIEKSQCITTGEGSEDFELKVEGADINGDGMGDRVIAQSTSSNKDSFSITLELQNETITQEFTGDMWPETYFYCADINGDGTSEIIFTDFASHSTANEAYCSIYSFHDGKLENLPLSNHDKMQMHKWELGTVDIKIIDENTVELFDAFSENPFIIELSSYKTGNFNNDISGDISLYASSQYTLSCWIESLDQTKCGFRLNRFVEMQFTNGVETDTAPRAIAVISSRIYWADDQWRLNNQEIMTEAEYYDASETYWSMMRNEAS